MSRTQHEAEDDVEKALKLVEVGGKLVSFLVPSIELKHGDCLSEFLYASGNYAGIIKKLYHLGILKQTLKKNTAVLFRKSLETFEVVIECCAYKFGSKQWKWMAIVATQLIKLAIRLYLTHVRHVVLDAAVAATRSGTPATCACGSHSCPNHTVLSDTLHSVRPLLHTLLYIGQGRDSWLPWLSAAFVDFLSLTCVPSLSCLDRSQLACYWSRVRELAAYLVRTPFHDKVAKPLVAWFADCPVPGLSRLFGLLLTYMIYWRLYYFNMWG